MQTVTFNYVEMCKTATKSETMRYGLKPPLIQCERPGLKYEIIEMVDVHDAG